MKFDWYIFRNLAIATVFVAVTLTGVIFLTQSLRFLELVIEAGASGSAFWLLTLLALPRFFEIILPLALMGACLFVYNKMTMDSEIVVMRATGTSPMRLARPGLVMAGIAVIFLWMTTMWLGPVSLAKMQHLRQVIKAQYSSLLFRDGVFNAAGEGLTVFIRDRTETGELRGMMIHDSRENDEEPVTILAKRGAIVSTPQGHQVIVYDGVRQAFDPQTRVLNRLEFQRYTIDLPEGSGAVRQRWREPDERTFIELLNPDPEDARDKESRWDFIVEAHRRVASPLLAPAFVLIALCSLLIGSVSRRGQSWRIVLAGAAVILIQGLYLAAFNLSRQTGWGLVLMYALALIPLAGGGYLLSAASEDLRRRLLFRTRRGAHK